jgi:hypothetical protein
MLTRLSMAIKFFMVIYALGLIMLYLSTDKYLVKLFYHRKLFSATKSGSVERPLLVQRPVCFHAFPPFTADPTLLESCPRNKFK